MTKYYASLVGPLHGLMYPLPFDDEDSNRFALNKSKLAKLWCAVYTAEEVKEQSTRFNLTILDDNQARYFDVDISEVEDICFR